MPSVKGHSYAGYVDAIYDILQTWRATAGARVSSESKSRDGIGYNYAFSGLPSGIRFGTEGFRFKAFDRTDYSAGGGAPFSDFLNGVASFGARDNIGRFDWSIGAQTRSTQYMTVFNGDGHDTSGKANPNLSDKVPSYTRVDIGVGYTIPNGRLRVDAFVLNLTDTVFMTSFINTPNLNLRFFNPPRQFGARISVQL